MKYPPLAFSSVNWHKIDVFTSNIMVLHHKMSQTVKIKVNRHTNIYLLMNLFSINHFILIFPVFQLFFNSYNKKFFLIILYFCCCYSLRLFMMQSYHIYSENINLTPIHRAESKWWIFHSGIEYPSDISSR